MKRSKILFVAAVIGTICAVYLFSYTNNTVTGEEVKAGSLIGAAIAFPSMLLSSISTIFSWVGFATKKRGFALTSGILYAVAIVLMLPWFMFNIVQMILCFIAYGTMGKVKKDG